MSGAPTGSTPLKRLGGGRWQTRDERFTIEPQSGTWVVIDAEQTDDLGLPLVRGPFSSLNAAKDAIEAARRAVAVVSPLEARVAASRPETRDDPTPEPASSAASPAKPTPRRTTARPAALPEVGRDAEPAGARALRPVEPVPRPGAPDRPVEPVEPRWLTALDPTDRRRARGLLAQLIADGARDPQGIVRRDIEGNVATTAAHAVRRAIEGLDPDASPATVARLLAEGRDDRLGIRWRLVDDRGRPIPLEVDALDRWIATATTAPDAAATRQGRG